MKKAHIILATLTILGLMTGCGGNANRSENANEKNQTGAAASEIIMTLKAEREVIFSIIGSQTVAIDWGDNSPIETTALENTTAYFSHNYAKKTEYTITVTGENITGLDCSAKKLTNLDVSKNPKLKRLYCQLSELTSLDVSKNIALEELTCSDNNLTTIDVSKNTTLEKLICEQNQLTTLDVSKNSALKELNCAHNQLKTLDVCKNTTLTQLNCSSNKLTTLDVNKNTKLEKLECGHNLELTSLDLSKNAALVNLDYSGTELAHLDISANKNLHSIKCRFIGFSAEALNALFQTLPDYGDKGDGEGRWIDIMYNPGADDCDWSIAEEKGWHVHVDYSEAG